MCKFVLDADQLDINLPRLIIDDTPSVDIALTFVPVLQIEAEVCSLKIFQLEYELDCALIKKTEMAKHVLHEIAFAGERLSARTGQCWRRAGQRLDKEFLPTR